MLIVQKAEYRFAFYPDTFAAAAYLKNHSDHPLDYQLIEGDMELIPAVSLVTTYGHTPEQQTMVVVFLNPERPFSPQIQSI
jgi:N-acyl homoserine lactone hydrolase